MNVITRFFFINKGLSYLLSTKYLERILNDTKHNSLLIPNAILTILLIVIVYISMFYLLQLCKEMYNEYIFNIYKIKVNRIQYILEHSFISSNNLDDNFRLSISSSKVNMLFNINNELKSEYVRVHNRSIFQSMKKTNISIFQSIINEINLDFNSCRFSGINSFNSSPIIERIDLNNVFNTLVANTVPISEPVIDNSVGINSNRNSLTLNTSVDSFINKPRNRELLNYQSNILYLLINKLSPSIY